MRGSGTPAFMEMAEKQSGICGDEIRNRGNIWKQMQQERS